MNLRTELKNYDGSPVLDGSGDNANPVTLGRTVLKALIAPLDGDEKMKPDEKLTLALLTRDVHAKIDGEINFTSEQVTLVKDRVAKAYAPIIMLAIWEILDPASVKSAA